MNKTKQNKIKQRGRGAAENITWGAEFIKCIDPNEGEALRRGAVERGGRGRGGGKGGTFYLGVELIKCIDPNEGEALRRGAVERGGRGRGGGKRGKFYLGGGIDQMY